jgi:hypothetical protein
MHVATKNPKLLVLDTVVLQRAGTSENLEAKRCYVFLQEIYNLRHKLVRTPEMTKEWQAHKTMIALGWLARMTANELVVEREDQEWPELRKALEELPENKGQKGANKDAFLVEAAWQADRVLLSCDEKARRAFCNLSERVPKLRSLQWCNPERHADAARWLRDGLPDEGETELSFRYDATAS